MDSYCSIPGFPPLIHFVSFSNQPIFMGILETGKSVMCCFALFPLLYGPTPPPVAEQRLLGPLGRLWFWGHLWKINFRILTPRRPTMKKTLNFHASEYSSYLSQNIFFLRDSPYKKGRHSVSVFAMMRNLCAFMMSLPCSLSITMPPLRTIFCFSSRSLNTKSFPACGERIYRINFM